MNKETNKRFVVAVTGASGSIYAQRLLDALEPTEHEVHLLISDYAKRVIQEELGELRIPSRFKNQSIKSMDVPFVSGSNSFDAMVIVPCSMGTLGRIAHGSSHNTITRAADVFLKEKRSLILVPREMPWHLIHARNVVTLIESGATMMPACPSFYSRPKTIEELADTIVARLLDHMKVKHNLSSRWKEEKTQTP